MASLMAVGGDMFWLLRVLGILLAVVWRLQTWQVLPVLVVLLVHRVWVSMALVEECGVGGWAAASVGGWVVIPPYRHWGLTQSPLQCLAWLQAWNQVTYRAVVTRHHD